MPRRIENTTEIMNTPEGQMARMLGILATGNPAGGAAMIERMESDGQRQLCRSSQLPTEGLAEVAAAIPALKVIGVTDGDPLFSDVELPEGWRVQPTGHAMWSELRDEKDRKRASVGYKAAYYDRWARISIVPRFSIEFDYSSPNYLSEAAYVVTDCGKQVWRSRVEPMPERGNWQAKDAIEVALRAEAAAWLEAQFPGWQNAGAYWD